MKKSKMTFAFVLIISMLLSSCAYLNLANTSASATVTPATTPAGVPGMTVNGVLYTDYYSLYPFTTSSMDVGFSQYGELINYTSGIGVGLQYPGHDQVGTYNQTLGTSVDPFANEIVPAYLWINGWMVNITYRNKVWEKNGIAYRNIWAFALFSDGIQGSIGKGWQNNQTAPETPNTGGRQTNKIAWTDPLQVIENNPRSFVAVSTTHINDTAKIGGALQSISLAEVQITINYNKDSKEVMLYKDVKITLNAKYLDGLIDVQLSNRGEWDLGPSSGPYKTWSYSYFYPEWGPCQYGFYNCWDNLISGAPWTTEPMVMKEYEENFTGRNADFEFTDSKGVEWWGWELTCPNYYDPFVPQSESVFVNGVYKIPGQYMMYTPSVGDTWLLFPLASIVAESTYSIQYKNYIYDSYWVGLPNLYSLAQMISAAPNGTSLPGSYVGFAAYWPVLSSYTVDGWGDSFNSLIGVTTQMQVSEPSNPFVIGQWDTELGINGQFRGVTVYGLTNWHDATNPNLAGPYDGTYSSWEYFSPFDYKVNVWDTGPPEYRLIPGYIFTEDSPIVDREVQYQLDQIFNPFNLNQAVEKSTSRWEVIYNVSATDVVHALANPSSWYLEIPLPYANVVYNLVWDQYASFSERVVWGGKLQYPLPADWTNGYARSVYSYTLGTYCMGYDGSDMMWYIEIPAAYLPPAGTMINIQFSTYTKNCESGTISTSTTSSHKQPEGNLLPEISYDKTQSWYDYLGANFEASIWGSVTPTIVVAPTADLNSTFTETKTIFQTWGNNITVYKESPAKIGGDDFTVPSSNVTGSNTGKLYFSTSDFGANLLITPPQGLDLYVDHIWAKITYTFTTYYIYHASNESSYYSTKVTISIQYDIRDRIPGTYEWGVVGKNAATIDSAGLAMVTAAFKDKEVEFDKAGADMNSTTLQLEMPFIMSNIQNGATRASYMDCLARTALRDHYCPTNASWVEWIYGNGWGYYWSAEPISCSNIIVEGGYSANLAAYYANDFTSANVDTNTGKIIALSCWSKHQYISNTTTGYAVVSTMLDPNGTVMFLLWGYDGRDTYWVSRWFQTDGIFELQNCSGFTGATSLILQINYGNKYYPTASSTNPTFNVVEILGTISETSTGEWKCVPGYGVEYIPKGGIHPDP